MTHAAPYLLALPWDDLLSLAAELVDGDHDDDAALDTLALVLDDLIDLSGVPVVGPALEAHDRELLRAVARWLLEEARDPERRERRRVRRERRRDRVTAWLRQIRGARSRR